MARRRKPSAPEQVSLRLGADTPAPGRRHRGYSDATLALLWGMSAGICAHPNCKETLLLGEPEGHTGIVLGERSHIYPISDFGPGGASTLSTVERNAYPNLILLCPTHHTHVDRIPMEDREATLQEWKRQREAWVSAMTLRRMNEVDFRELKAILDFLADSSVGPDETPSRPTAPREKLTKNDLSVRVHRMVAAGNCRVTEVADFIEHQGAMNPKWVQRLRSGFQQEYALRRKQGLHGDALWYTLLHFACGGSGSYEDMSAGCAVMTHLFQLCEIFDP